MRSEPRGLRVRGGVRVGLGTYCTVHVESAWSLVQATSSRDDTCLKQRAGESGRRSYVCIRWCVIGRDSDWFQWRAAPAAGISSPRVLVFGGAVLSPSRVSGVRRSVYARALPGYTIHRSYNTRHTASTHRSPHPPAQGWCCPPPSMPVPRTPINRCSNRCHLTRKPSILQPPIPCTAIWRVRLFERVAASPRATRHLI